MSKLEFDIVHWSSLKHKAADALSKFPAVGTGILTFHDEVSPLNINAETFKIVYEVKIELEEEEAEDCITILNDFVPCLPEVFALVNKYQQLVLKTPEHHEFNSTQTTDSECHLAAATAALPRTSFSYDAYIVFISVLHSHEASQRYVPASLRPSILRLSH